MAVSIRVTVTASCWKQHTCVACGGVFRYLMRRSGSAGGRPGEDVKSWAEQEVANKLANEIDECPCPLCGTVQPDMVGSAKVSYHRALTAIAAIVCLVIMLPTFTGHLPLDVAGKVAATVAGFTALGHLFVALRNPNRNRERNLRNVQGRVALGTVLVVHAGEGEQVPIPRNISLVHALGLLAILAAPLAFLAVVFVSDDQPMARNVGLQPDVIGPGDEVTIPMDSNLRSYGGNWRGTTVTAHVVNAAELGIAPTLPVATSTKHWGKDNTKRSFDPVKAWVRIGIPDNAALGGQTLHLKVKLAVAYPTQGGKSSAEQNGVVEKDLRIELTDASAATMYKSTWDIGKWAGLGGCVLGGLTLVVLGERLRRRAFPNEAFAAADNATTGAVGGFSSSWKGR